MDGGLLIQQNSTEQWKITKKNLKFKFAEVDALQKQCWMRNVAKGEIQGTILRMFKWKINALWINICIEKYKICMEITHMHMHTNFRIIITWGVGVKENAWE